MPFDPVTAGILGGGALLGGGLDFLTGSRAGATAGISNSQTFDRILNAKLMSQMDLRRSYALAEPFYRNALASVEQGYDRAFKEAGRFGAASKQSTLDRETQLTGSVQSSLQGRGLASTTVLDNARRGIASDTGRRLQEIDSALAGLYSGLAKEKGVAVAGAQQNFGQFLLGQGQGEMGIRQNYISNILGQGGRPIGQPSNFGGAFGSLLPLLLMGGGGGGKGIDPSKYMPSSGAGTFPGFGI